MATKAEDPIASVPMEGVRCNGAGFIQGSGHGWGTTSGSGWADSGDGQYAGECTVWGYGRGSGSGIGKGEDDIWGSGRGDDSKCKEIELNILSHIPDKDLPLFIGVWEFAETKTKFETRLKGSHNG